MSASPLDPDLQDRTSVTRVGRRGLSDMPPAVLYEFEISPNEDARARGKVWLAAESGLPLRMERTVEPPLMAITSFSVVQTYEPQHDFWLSTSMRFEVTGRLLFVERQVDVRMDLREHRYEPEVARALEDQRAQ